MMKYIIILREYAKKYMLYVDNESRYNSLRLRLRSATSLYEGGRKRFPFVEGEKARGIYVGGVGSWLPQIQALIPLMLCIRNGIIYLTSHRIMEIKIIGSCF